ncbi:MAG: dihydrodipicolinate synthase family protein, partial [Thiomonas sp.]
MSVFSGIWVPLVTPFTPQGGVDHAALARLARRLIADGVSGLVALGTTGEPSSLDAAEQRAVLDTVLDAAGATPVVVGLAGNNTAELLATVERLENHPLAGLLVPAPYYVRPSQEGIRRHFHSLANASRHPVVIYDIPYRTGVEIATDTLLDLAGHANIVAVKDCGGSIDKTLTLLQDGRLRVLAGEDLQMFSTRCLGGRGAIAASAHVRTRDLVAMDRAIAEGRLG